MPAEWLRILDEDVALASTLNQAETVQLHDLVRLLLSDIDVEASQGFDVGDRHRVVVAAGAAMLLLGTELEQLRRIRSVIVHPSTVNLPGERATGMRGVVTEGSGPLHGQASMGGPVILSWQAALRGSRQPWTGHHVVIHEFAHALDMGDGAADGTPLLGDRDVDRERYRRVLQHHLDSLRRRPDPVLRPYGATNPAEFFAVATEVFFGRPRELAAIHPDLYEVLAGTYAQDPAGRPLAAGRPEPEQPAEAPSTSINAADVISGRTHGEN